MHAETFCGAPWFQIRNENHGQLKPCCVIDPSASDFKGNKNFLSAENSIDSYMNSDWLRYLRHQLMQGNRVKECQRCWTKENFGVTSERQIVNQKLGFDKPWMSAYFRKNGAESWKLLSADWKHNNLCNLGCIMCSPLDSSTLYSQWRRNEQNPIVRSGSEFFGHDWQKIVKIWNEDTQQRWLDQILDQPSLRWLKILGGEPFMQPSMLERLYSLSIERKRQIHLHFITNGTQDMQATAEKLHGYRDLSFSISIDGIGVVQEWIRAGSKWSHIEANTLAIKKTHRVYVHCVLQTVNLPWLAQLWNWCVNHDLPLDIEVLRNPKHLSVSVIDLSQRKSYLDQVQTALIAEDIPSHESKRICFQDLRDQIMSISYTPELVSKFWHHIELHDKINGFADHSVVKLQRYGTW